MVQRIKKLYDSWTVFTILFIFMITFEVLIRYKSFTGQH